LLMTAVDNGRAGALDRIREKSRELEDVQASATASIAAAGAARAQAVRDALMVILARELASEMGVSVQRVYQLAREASGKVG